MGNLVFTETPNLGHKTRHWFVNSAHDQSALGTVYWYTRWRRYIFRAATALAVFDASCLTEISNFLQFETTKEKGRR